MNDSMTAGNPTPGKEDFFTFTVGKLDAGMAILIGERASLIEFPSILLPQGIGNGSVVNIRVHRNQAEEKKKKADFEDLQEEILEAFGKVGPQAPDLRLKNVTQTSVTLEWDRVFLGSGNLIGLDIFRNGQRLAPIPNPLHNTSTKLSGLDVDAEYSFHLLLRTTAGTFASPVVKARTHTVQDTSGIAVCFGHIEDPEMEAAAKDALKLMGCQKWTEKIQIETTHFVCTDPRSRADGVEGQPGAMYSKAAQLSIPIVQPHWVFACYTQRRMVPISAYYLGQDPANASTVRETMAQIRQPPNSSASEQHMVPPTPLTAGVEPQTPGNVPHIDAQTGETRTGGVSVREGLPQIDKEDAPAAEQPEGNKQDQLPEPPIEKDAEEASTAPPTPYEKDSHFTNGPSAEAPSSMYAQAATPVEPVPAPVPTPSKAPETEAPSAATTDSQEEKEALAQQEHEQEGQADSMPTPTISIDEPPAEEEIDLS